MTRSNSMKVSVQEKEGFSIRKYIKVLILDRDLMEHEKDSENETRHLLKSFVHLPRISNRLEVKIISYRRAYRLLIPLLDVAIKLSRLEFHRL